MLDLYYMNVSGDCSYEQSLALYEMLCDDRKNRVDKLKRSEIKKKQILTGVFLQHCLSQYMSIEAKDIKFKYNSYGKPFVDFRRNDVKDYKKIFFNLSHSGDYAVLGVSDSPVGIDIEKKRKDRMAVAKRFFHKDEYEYISAAESDDEMDDRFLECWTLKEAYVKYRGEGLAIPLASFCVVPGGKYYSVLSDEALDVLLISFPFAEQYRISVCFEKDKNITNMTKKLIKTDDFF